MRNTLLLQTVLLTKDKYEVVKRKPVVGCDSRKAWTYNSFGKEALTQMLSCEICKISGTHFSQSTSGWLQWLIKYELLIVRSSHQKCSLKKGVLKKFTKFTGKYPSRVSYLIKFQERCFPMDFEKVFESTFFTEHLWTTAFLSSAFCCALGHFFINKNLCACTLLGFKLIQKIHIQTLHVNTQLRFRTTLSSTPPSPKKNLIPKFQSKGKTSSSCIPIFNNF